MPARHRLWRGRHRKVAARRRIRATRGRLLTRPGRTVPLLRRRDHVLADRRGRAGCRRDPRWRRRSRRCVESSSHDCRRPRTGSASSTPCRRSSGSPTRRSRRVNRRGRSAGSSRGWRPQGPVVLIVEDIHWAEPTLLDLLETIADWLRDTPLLVVCTARAEIFERRPGWGGGRPDAAVLAVRPLSRADTDLLIQNLVRHPGLDTDAKERIAMAAEGNPLFVEQLLSMWIDEGYLRQEGDAWSLAADLTRGVAADQCADVADGAAGSTPCSRAIGPRDRIRDRPFLRRGRGRGAHRWRARVTSCRASASWSART